MFRAMDPIMVDMDGSIVTLPLNVYLELCAKHGRDEDEDEFLMYTYKVRRCPQTGAHDWTECPFAHRGEKARRRDPRKFPYMGFVCPDFKQGECRKGPNCEFAHGVFEFWLHPSRFRTRPCESGVLCPRKVCFFAHTREQLREEGVHHCSRCVHRGPKTASPSPSPSPMPSDVAAVAQTRLAASPEVSSVAGGADLDYGYEDYPHLWWLQELVNG